MEAATPVALSFEVMYCRSNIRQGITMSIKFTRWLLNTRTAAEAAQSETSGGDSPIPAAVNSPAFSLTKVLATGSAVIGPLAAALADWIGQEDINLQTRDYVTLMLGLLGFLAITGASDVLARAIATGGEATATKARLDSDDARLRRDTENLLAFPKPFNASYVSPGSAQPDGSVSDPTEVEIVVLAATGGATTFFLTKEGQKLRWMAADRVTLSGPAPE
jgi:hypothetical protein